MAIMRLALACSVAGTLTALALVPQAAHANSCIPTVGQMIPEDGQPMAANARALAEGDCGIDTTGWVVDVDGDPSDLKVNAAEFPGSFTTIWVEPPPESGSVVEIFGCIEGCVGDDPEYDLTRIYDIQDDDLSAPEAPSLYDLSFEDEIVEQWNWDSDDPEPELVAVRHWTLRYMRPSFAQPLVWEIEIGPAGSTTDMARIMLDNAESLVVDRYVADAGEQVCATVRAYDLANNISEDSVVCVQVGDDQDLPEVPGSGDGGSSGDGGGTDGGGGTDDGDDTGDDSDDDTNGGGGGGDGGGDGGAGLDDDEASGCGCTASGDSPVGLSALLGLMMLGLRRRSRR